MSRKGSTKVDPAVIIAAVKKCRGIRTRVAEMLGISRSTLHQYMDKYPEVQEAFHDADNTMLDAVENKLEFFTQGYIPRPDGTKETVPLALQLDAVKFFLRCKGKERGYTERVEQEVSGKGGVPLAPPTLVIQPVRAAKAEDTGDDEEA
jgi:hypothetical protein